MANNVFAPGQQFFTSTGALASGQLVYIYQSGTTTKQTIYGTAANADAGTNSIANPLTLTSTGELSTDGSTPTSVYVTNATASVKVVRTTASDTDPPTSPVRTEDT